MRKRECTEKTFEKIMTPNFLNKLKRVSSCIQEAK